VRWVEELSLLPEPAVAVWSAGVNQLASGVSPRGVPTRGLVRVHGVTRRW